MILGYKFGGHDDGSRMFERDDARFEYCSGCGQPLELPTLNPLYAPRKRRDVLEFDPRKAGTRFMEQCEQCDRFYAVVGFTPISLKEPRSLPLPNRLFRTDLEFGSGDQQNPLLLVGPRLGHELLAAELSGANITPFGDAAGPQST